MRNARVPALFPGTPAHSSLCHSSASGLWFQTFLLTCLWFPGLITAYHALCLLSPFALCALRLTWRSACLFWCLLSAPACQPVSALLRSPSHPPPACKRSPVGLGHGFPFHFSVALVNKRRPFLKNETGKLCEGSGDFSDPQETGPHEKNLSDRSKQKGSMPGSCLLRVVDLVSVGPGSVCKGGDHYGFLR